ncbi:MAG: hypothetical protein ACJA0N_001605 [Pseudohongiellaceae bacterium]|jgi:hypothetical protein
MQGYTAQVPSYRQFAFSNLPHLHSSYFSYSNTSYLEQLLYSFFEFTKLNPCLPILSFSNKKAAA